MLDSAQGALEIRVFGFPQFWGVYSRPGSQKDKPSEQARNGQFVALNKEGVDFSIAQSVADSKSIRTRWSGRLPHSVFTVSDPNRSATAESEEQPSHAGGLDSIVATTLLRTLRAWQAQGRLRLGLRFGRKQSPAVHFHSEVDEAIQLGNHFDTVAAFFDDAFAEPVISDETFQTVGKDG